MGSFDHHATHAPHAALPGRFFATDLGSFAILTLNRFVHFLAMNRHMGWGFNAQANFVTANVNYGDNNLIADHDAFVAVAG
jgi:hypothetical protein